MAYVMMVGQGRHGQSVVASSVPIHLNGCGDDGDWKGVAMTSRHDVVTQVMPHRH